MLGPIEYVLLPVSVILITGGLLRRLRAYRSLLLGGGVLALITALFPRPGNSLGHYLFTGPSGISRLPVEMFGIVWWLLGAWLLSSVLGMVLKRTLFPADDEPHARRLFADLASVLIYVIALVGIMDTIFKQPIATVLATSGVLAIVLGLALQNTLSDVFSGLALNVERPFRAGDWITLAGGVEGQVIEINWRATRIKTSANELVIIPNSVVSKATVTNHRRLYEPPICTLTLKIDASVPAAQVITALQAAAKDCAGIEVGSTPNAYASQITDGTVTYAIDYAVGDFTRRSQVQSDLIQRLTDALRATHIPLGTAPVTVRLLQCSGDEPAGTAVGATLVGAATGGSPVAGAAAGVAAGAANAGGALTEPVASGVLPSSHCIPRTAASTKI